MLVVELVVMMGLAAVDLVLDRKAEPEQDRRDRPCRWSTARCLTARDRCSADDGVGAGGAGGVDQVALRQDHEVGAGDLVLEHLLDRVVMVERGIGAALRGERVHVGGDAAFGEGRPVDHGDNAVDGDAALDRGPLEGLDQRLRQRQARRLDQYVVDPGRARQDQVERRHEIVGDGAADAAIGELDDILLRAGLDAAALQDVAVDADVAELVDDDRQPPAAGVFQDVADQRRLAGAEKAGDDGAGDARQRCGHDLLPMRVRGGMRATRPRFKLSGRPRHGSRPSVEVANRRAPSTRSAALSTARSPNT